MSSLVEKGNTIHVPVESLGGEESNKVTVSWSQMLKTRTQDYYVCKYTVKSGGSADGVLYIQTDKIDELKSKNTDGEDITLTVDDSFQYGQTKDKSKRFLVFHNKDNKPYQHRFVENILTKLGGKAVEIAELLGYKDAHNVGDFAKNFVGDYLHNY